MDVKCRICNKAITGRGETGLCRSCCVTERNKTESQRKAVSISQQGENNWNWSGDKANHLTQMKRCWKARGKAKLQDCLHCSENGIKKPAFDWAHIHGKSGLDVWADFIPLCRSCHMTYDGHGRKAARTRKRRGTNRGGNVTRAPWSAARWEAYYRRYGKRNEQI
jgi:hypothetical protein